MNKRTLTSLFLTFVVTFSSLAPGLSGLQASTAHAAPGDPLVCHVPLDDPENPYTLAVDPGDLQTHLDHGDTEGPCDTDPTNDACEFVDGIRVEMTWGDVEDNVLFPPPAVEFDGVVTISGGSMELELPLPSIWDDHDIMGSTEPTSIDWESDIFHHIDGFAFYAYEDLGETAEISVSNTQFAEETYTFAELRSGVDIDLGDYNFVLTTEEISDERVCGAGTITVYKDVITDNGAIFVEDDFFPTIDDVEYEWEETVNLFVGQYSIDEEENTVISDLYEATFSDDCDADGDITLAADENLTCTITNDDVEPESAYVTVVKEVINDDGGTTDAATFAGSITVNSVQVDLTNDDVSGVSATSSALPVTAGDEIGVTEDLTAHPGYVLDSVVCTDNDTQNEEQRPLILDEGQSVTCVFINNDIAGNEESAEVTITKVVNNDDGGTAGVNDFLLYLEDGDQVETRFFSGETHSVATGPALVYEAPEVGGMGNYVASFSGDCDENGAFSSLENGESYTCTITNTYVPEACNYNDGVLVEMLWGDVDGSLGGGQGDNAFDGSVTIADGGLDLIDTIRWDGRDSIETDSTSLIEWISNIKSGYDGIEFEAFSNDGATAVVTIDGVDYGPLGYTFDELRAGVLVPVNQFNVSLTATTLSDEDICDGPEQGPDNVDTTLTIVKTFEDLGDLTLSPSDFTFYANDILFESGDAQTVTPGDYVVTEETDLALYYEATFGGDCDENGELTLLEGDNATCTITNRILDVDGPNITIIKTVIGGEATAADFEFLVRNTADSPGVGAVVSSGDTIGVAAGDYQISEYSGPIEDYTATYGGDCASDGTLTMENVIDPSPEEEGGISYTCTVVNTAVELICTESEQILLNPGFEATDDRRGEVFAHVLETLTTWDLYASLPDVVDGLATSWYSDETAGIELQRSGHVVPSHSGNYHMEMDTHPNTDLGNVTNTVVSQDVTLSGGDYELSYWYRARTQTQDDNIVEVLLDGEIVATSNTTFSTWVQETVLLEDVLPGEHTVSFRGAGRQNSLGGFIDDVSLICDAPDQNPEPEEPELTITKVVVNDGGGSLTVDDFDLFVDDGAENTIAFTSGETHTIATGAAFVYESGDLSDYIASFSGDCDENGTFTAVEDGNYTCTITNTYDDGGNPGGGNPEEDARVTVYVNIINDDGGVMVPADATVDLYVDDGGAGLALAAIVLHSSFPGDDNGTTTVLDPNLDYIVDSTQREGYDRSTTGDCEGTTVEGVTQICTITYDDIFNGSTTSNGGSGGGGGGSTPTPDPIVLDDTDEQPPEPIVLGDTDEQPPAVEEESAPEPIVLGETDELPRTGTPITLLGLGAVIAMAATGLRRKK